MGELHSRFTRPAPKSADIKRANARYDTRCRKVCKALGLRYYGINIVNGGFEYIAKKETNEHGSHTFTAGHEMLLAVERLLRPKGQASECGCGQPCCAVCN